MVGAVLRRVLALVSSLVLFLALAACSKPQPPKLVPKAAQVIAIDPQGISLELTVEMTNPNSFTLGVQSVTGHVVLGDGSDLGEVRVAQAISLPPNVPTLVKVPMNIRWAGVAGLAANAMSGKDVPFTVSGSVGVGSEKLNVDVPYSMAGTITQDLIRRSIITSLGKLPLPVGSINGIPIPALPLPTAAPVAPPK